MSMAYSNKDLLFESKQKSFCSQSLTILKSNKLQKKAKI